MTTAGFAIKTLKVPSAFRQQFDAPGKKKSLIEAPLGKSHAHTRAITSQPRDAPAGPKGRRVPAGILRIPRHNTPSS